MILIKEIRGALGLTQRKLSQEIGFTEGMISRWERGEIVSVAAQEKLKAYAIKQGRGDLAALLDQKPPQVRRVAYPPKSPGGEAGPHVLLDEILQSDDDSAKLAVENFLRFMAQYLRGPK